MPSITCIKTLVAIEAHRFETVKNKFRPDHNKSRSWHGWHRKLSMVMLGFAMMAAIRHHANPKNATQRQSNGKNKSIATPSLIRWSIQEVRRIAEARWKANSSRAHHRMVTLAQSRRNHPALNHVTDHIIASLVGTP